MSGSAYPAKQITFTFQTWEDLSSQLFSALSHLGGEKMAQDAVAIGTNGQPGGVANPVGGPAHVAPSVQPTAPLFPPPGPGGSQTSQEVLAEKAKADVNQAVKKASRGKKTVGVTALVNELHNQAPAQPSPAAHAPASPSPFGNPAATAPLAQPAVDPAIKAPASSADPISRNEFIAHYGVIVPDLLGRGLNAEYWQAVNRENGVEFIYQAHGNGDILGKIYDRLVRDNVLVFKQ